MAYSNQTLTCGIGCYKDSIMHQMTMRNRGFCLALGVQLTHKSWLSKLKVTSFLLEEYDFETNFVFLFSFSFLSWTLDPTIIDSAWFTTVFLSVYYNEQPTNFTVLYNFLTNNFQAIIQV